MAIGRHCIAVRSSGAISWSSMRFRELSLIHIYRIDLVREIVACDLTLYVLPDVLRYIMQGDVYKRQAPGPQGPGAFFMESRGIRESRCPRPATGWRFRTAAGP